MAASSSSPDTAVAAALTDDNVAMVGIAVAVVAVIVGSAILFLKLKKKGSLNPEKWTSFMLEKKTQVSPNVVKLRFALASKTAILGLPIGQHVSCRGTDLEGEEVIKPYTPTTLDSDVGYFELVVKVYEKGRMSGYFGRMKEGEYLMCKGPKGRFRYTPNMMRAFGMIAGGTGLTPCYQVTRAILENPKDKTVVSLIYANVTFDDILLKDDLDRMAKEFPDRFKVYYVLNQPPAGWEGGVGFVSAEMIKEHLPAPAVDIQILRCGPPPMNKAMATHLDSLGYTKEMQFQF
ncbi:hypothetical protein R1flu_028971 [Riccia fluitans]|uniref:NADH-cytochrome b5 reductase n=1 Tax=Riccia fluitans TaxID=41844 RepID=A0ABD1XNV7_9MARC